MKCARSELHCPRTRKSDSAAGIVPDGLVILDHYFECKFWDKSPADRRRRVRTQLAGRSLQMPHDFITIGALRRNRHNEQTTRVRRRFDRCHGERLQHFVATSSQRGVQGIFYLLTQLKAFAASSLRCLPGLAVKLLRVAAILGTEFGRKVR